MSSEWNKLTALTRNQEFLVTRVSLKSDDISIEGEFELPPLARLPYEDQIFIAMFVQCHGSIKQMEKAFGVSYPTIKGRLNRISEMLGFVEVRTTPQIDAVLSQLERGEISPQDAIRKIKESGGYP
jgi:hypothetical protein